MMLYLFGGFRLTVNGEHREVSSKKAKALLCRLALDSGTSFSRENLAALLWPDSAAATARQSLRQTLSEMRRAVGMPDWLIADNIQLALNTVLVSSDVAQFTAVSKSSDQHSIQNSLALYRGELLEGMSLGNSEFDNWLQTSREMLRQQALKFCDRLIQDCDSDGEALPLYQRMLELDPTLERAHQALMEIYISQGNEIVAIKQYSLLKHILNQELGVEPDAEITSLYEALLKHRDREVPNAVVAPSAMHVDELRPVSVLCFRIISHGIDPESIALERHRVSGEIAPIIAQYGGRVTQQLDQICTVVFGLDVIHGTEVDRARLAAQGCVNKIGSLACGISTGRVLYQKGKQHLDGEPVSSAMKLANFAGVDEIWLDSKARAALRVRVSTEAIDAESWRISVDENVDLTLVPLIGRELELRHFLALHDIAAETDRGSVLLLRGDAGIGKSRLSEEFQALADAQGTVVIKAEVADYQVEPGMDTVGQLLSKLMGFRPGEQPDRVSLINSSSAEQLPFVLEMLGQPLNANEVDLLMNHSDQHRAKHRSAVLKQQITRASQSSTVLIIIEDIHWADATTLEQLSILSSIVNDLPVLLVMSTRTQGEAFDPAWRGAMSGTSLLTLDLQPLKDTEASRVAHQLGLNDETFIQRLVERAGGNPLFIEQLAAGDPTGKEIPANIQSLIVARLDKLPTQTRKVLSAASILGSQFTEDALTGLLGHKPGLESLANEGMLKETDMGWRFHHALIHECCYQHMLNRERKTLHQAAADYYKSVDPVQFANHLYLAGNSEAGDALLAAAEVARDRLRLDDALRMLAQVIEDFPKLTFQALVLQGETYLQQGKAAVSRDIYEQAIKFSNDDIELASCLLGRGKALGFMDDFEPAINDLRRASTLIKTPNKTSIDIYRHLGNALFPLGRLDECLEAHGASLRTAQKINDPYRIALAEGGLGDAYYQRGAMGVSNQHYARCVELAKKNGYISAIPANMAMQSLTALFVFDAEIAAQLAEEALVISTKTGDIRHEILANSVIGFIQLFYGDIERSLRSNLHVVELSRKFGSTRFQLDGMANLAYLYCCTDNRKQALDTLEQAQLLLSERELLPFSGPYIFGLQAYLAETEEECQAWLQKGFDILDSGAVSHNYYNFFIVAMDSYLIWNNVDGVRRSLCGLEAYAGEYNLPWVRFFTDRARFLAGLDETGLTAQDINDRAASLKFDSPIASIEPALAL